MSKDTKASDYINKFKNTQYLDMLSPRYYKERNMMLFLLSIIKGYMKKYYSKKERQQRKNLTITIITTLVILISVSVLLSIKGPDDNMPRYTAEQMLHDHDGDGIPDH
jgi:membrane-associated HD superfamily phosphohydrolase